MDGSRLARLIRGPLSRSPQRSGEALALVPHSRVHVGSEHPLPLGEGGGEGLPRFAGPRVETGSEHPISREGRRDDLPRVTPPLGAAARDGRARGRGTALVSDRGAWERLRAPLLPDSAPTWVSAAHSALVQDKRGIVATMVRVLVQAATSSSSPRHGKGGTRARSSSLQSTGVPRPYRELRSWLGLLPHSTTTGAELPARPGGRGMDRTLAPVLSQGKRVLATRVHSVSGGMGRTSIPAPSQREMGGGVEAEREARDWRQSLTPALFQKEGVLATRAHPVVNGMGETLTPVPSQREKGSGAEAGTATLDSGQSLKSALSQRERGPSTQAPQVVGGMGGTLTPAPSPRETGGGTGARPATRDSGPSPTPALSQGQGGLATQARPVVNGMGGTLAPVSFQQERVAGVEIDTAEHDLAQPLTPILPQKGLGLATQVYPREGNIGSALTPVLSAPTPRELPPPRRFSLAIGRLEIRTRPPPSPRTPAPLSIRTHQIDPGLGPGLIRLGSTPW